MRISRQWSKRRSYKNHFNFNLIKGPCSVKMWGKKSIDAPHMQTLNTLWTYSTNFERCQGNICPFMTNTFFSVPKISTGASEVIYKIHEKCVLKTERNGMEWNGKWKCWTNVRWKKSENEKQHKWKRERWREGDRRFNWIVHWNRDCPS